MHFKMKEFTSIVENLDNTEEGNNYLEWLNYKNSNFHNFCVLLFHLTLRCRPLDSLQKHNF